MKHSLAIISGLLLACTFPAAAWSHGSTEPQHGGVVQMNGESVFELVQAPDGVALYLREEDEPVAANGSTARLRVTIGGEQQDFAMVPGDGNQFFAPGLTLPSGARVGVLVINQTTQARVGTTFVIG